MRPRLVVRSRGFSIRRSRWMPGWRVEPTSGSQIVLTAKQVVEDHLVERLIMAIGDELLRGRLVEGTDFLDQAQEGAATVEEMIHPVLRLRGTERMHVEADVFALVAVAVALEGAHLVEGAAQAHIAERAILIIFQPVLVIQVQ